METFLTFMKTYNKTYETSDEMVNRFKIFKVI